MNRIVRISQFGVRAVRVQALADSKGFGVNIKSNGLPDFSSYLYDSPGKKSTVFIKLTGSRSKDFKKANNKAGLKFTPKGYTWHHHEVMGIMELVKTEVHNEHGHSGGALFWDITGNTFKYRK